MNPPICHYPAGDRCQYCRAGVRHAHQWNNPYPTWSGPLPDTFDPDPDPPGEDPWIDRKDDDR